MTAPSARIGNAGGFWGDEPGAPARLLDGRPDLDYLTIDYLSEVSLSILARQRERDPALGYAADFIAAIRSLGPHWARGSPVKVIANAGGLNPRSCAGRCAEALREEGCRGRRIGIVGGDDVLPVIREALEAGGGRGFENLETGRPISDIAGRLVTANAYLGAEPIAAALQAGADIVVAGRVADPSLAVAACLHHHGWDPADLDRVAGATVAGHLIECGTQVTGGISTNWLELPCPERIGFPVAEVDGGGGCTVTKPEGTGGRVSAETVKEQLLYEIGDPGAYLSPDVTASFLTLAVEDLGRDRVSVRGATGRPPPDSLKVSATYRAGWRAAGTLVIPGPRAREKAERCGRIVLARLREMGLPPAETAVECLGAGAVAAGAASCEAPEVVLRIAVSDEGRRAVELFATALMPLVTAGPPGTTGYAEGRPRVREVFGYWPCRIPRDRVRPWMEMIEA